MLEYYQNCYCRLAQSTCNFSIDHDTKKKLTIFFVKQIAGRFAEISKAWWYLRHGYLILLGNNAGIHTMI